jgi:signal peptidase I
MTKTVGRLWKNDYFKTAIMIIVVIAVVFGLWFGSQMILGTPYPALAVASGSMCQVQVDSGNGCDGWSHPFGRTLHTGDLIIIKAMDPKQIITGIQPSGDIIVFHRPNSDELIVHRAIANMTGPDGLIYFETKGDWSGPQGGPDGLGWISQKAVVGIVVMRIPWLGHLALFMRESSALYIIIAIIIVLIIVEFVLPTSKTDKTGIEPEKKVESPMKPEAQPT